MKRNSVLYILIKFVVFSVCLMSMHTYIRSLFLPTTRVHALQAQESIVVSELVTTAQPLPSNNKRIYIYSTHQQEEYEDAGVFEASHYLANCLQTLGYEVIVEENNFYDYASNNGLNYNHLYQVSNIFLNQALKTYGSFDFIIDFHRDSVGANVTQLVTDTKNYAKLMFVVGGLSDKVETVKETSQILSNNVENYQPGISRGVMVREAYYNQYVSDHMVLIEVGGVENTYEEIKNSLDILAKGIHDYLKTI